MALETLPSLCSTHWPESVPLVALSENFIFNKGGRSVLMSTSPDANSYKPAAGQAKQGVPSGKQEAGALRQNVRFASHTGCECRTKPPPCQIDPRMPAPAASGTPRGRRGPPSTSPNAPGSVLALPGSPLPTRTVPTPQTLQRGVLGTWPLARTCSSPSTLLTRHNVNSPSPHRGWTQDTDIPDQGSGKSIVHFPSCAAIITLLPAS